MKIQTTKPFDQDYNTLPETIKDQADKQFALLMKNPHHPSLRLKKIKGHPNIWEGRVTKSYCFTFQITGEIYLFRRIGTHNILKTP
jgi:mRNA-degrading endonuclease YafQ of YafQ-DinJ toxin-antitoxin module